MTGFTGEVHPYTAEYPILPDDELADLAADIAENGLRNPLTVDRDWRLIDGQNRLAACELAGVEPVFEVLDFVDDAAVAAFVSSKNDRRRSQSPGVRWMRVGKSLKRQGKRRNGRWERETFDSPEFGNIDKSGQNAMSMVGLVTATLPALWSMYQMHLDAVRAMSQANHPSRRTP